MCILLPPKLWAKAAKQFRNMCRISLKNAKNKLLATSIKVEFHNLIFSLFTKNFSQSFLQISFTIHLGWIWVSNLDQFQHKIVVCNSIVWQVEMTRFACFRVARHGWRMRWAPSLVRHVTTIAWIRDVHYLVQTQTGSIQSECILSDPWFKKFCDSVLDLIRSGHQSRPTTDYFKKKTKIKIGSWLLLWFHRTLSHIAFHHSKLRSLKLLYTFQ